MDYALAITAEEQEPETVDETQVHNINSRGVFFYLAHALPLDKIVHLNIDVAPGGGWMQRKIEVKAEGRVVRSQPEESPPQRFGTAVEFVRPLTLRFEGNYATS